jgi:phosphoribosyl-AMP cyclohydrolase
MRTADRHRTGPTGNNIDSQRIGKGECNRVLVPQNLKFDEHGLLPAVIQDAENGQVLMVGYMNREAVERTVSTLRVTFWSRSRQKYWVKGETSGNIQRVHDIYVDCDQDCLLVKVEQTGAACHEGYRSCFFRRVDSDGEKLTTVSDPISGSY